MESEEAPRIKTSLQYTGKQYRTTIPQNIAHFLEMNEGDFLNWALDFNADISQKKVMLKLSRVGQDDGSRNRMKTRIQKQGEQYRITVPASIVQILGLRKGYLIYWNFFPNDEYMTIKFASS